MSEAAAANQTVVDNIASRVPSARAGQVKITEIFRSIQGESSLAGWPTAFVRLTGCPLRCTYCDTEYAFYGGEWMDHGAVLSQVQALGVRHVCVTGGEPLAQKQAPQLLSALCDAGYTVSLETSGAMDVKPVDPRVIKILDVKTPDSGEQPRNRLENLGCLLAHDEIKFVVCSRADFEWSENFIRAHGLAGRQALLVSPSYGQVQPAELAEWIVHSDLPLRMNLQLHKTIWGEEPGR